VELINRLINVHLKEVSSKIEGLATDANTVEDYKIQTIDPTIKFDLYQNSPGREAAETVMSLYKIQSEQYFIALTILRNKIKGAAHDALTNHVTVLNFRAILSRLDFIYSAKRPIHTLESELSILMQGRMTVTE